MPSSMTAAFFTSPCPSKFDLDVSGSNPLALEIDGEVYSPVIACHLDFEFKLTIDLARRVSPRRKGFELDLACPEDLAQFPHGWSPSSGGRRSRTAEDLLHDWASVFIVIREKSNVGASDWSFGIDVVALFRRSAYNLRLSAIVHTSLRNHFI
jgi:hypothetical protein